MARWTGTWLSGPKAALEPGEDASPAERQRWRGERLGMPADGVGALAGSPRRGCGLLLDVIVAGLITAMFVRPQLASTEAMQAYNYASILVWALLTTAPVAVFGVTPGMAMAGVRVGRLDGAASVGLWRAVVRCALSFLLLPLVLFDADRRGLHDRLTGTAVVRLR